MELLILNFFTEVSCNILFILFYRNMRGGRPFRRGRGGPPMRGGMMRGGMMGFKPSPPYVRVFFHFIKQCLTLTVFSRDSRVIPNTEIRNSLLISGILFVSNTVFLMKFLNIN